MLVYKSADNVKFFSALNLPSYMRDWLVMRFSDDEGKIDIGEISNYIKNNEKYFVVLIGDDNLEIAYTVQHISKKLFRAKHNGKNI